MTSDKQKPSRQNSILTNTQRHFLRVRNDNKNKGAKAQTKRRMRKRIVNGILDFQLLNELLDPNEIELIFDTDRWSHPSKNKPDFPSHRYKSHHQNSKLNTRGSENPKIATTMFERTMIDAVAFLWRGAHQLTAVDFEQVVEQGITKAAKLHDKRAEVSIELKDKDVDLLLDKIDSGDISREEFFILLEEDPSVFQQEQEKREQSEPGTDPSADDRPDPPQWMKDRRQDEE